MAAGGEWRMERDGIVSQIGARDWDVNRGKRASHQHDNRSPFGLSLLLWETMVASREVSATASIRFRLFLNYDRDSRQLKSCH